MFYIDGKHVRAYREMHHLSQRALADAAGLSTHTISAIERGVHGAQHATVIALARVMVISPSELAIDDAYQPRTRAVRDNHPAVQGSDG